ncbi:lysophospholipid acyltransferase 7 [Metopolophium dirhodum]|uniref:lysophospholipid acyltransferase 7 n=1 Tax=Metopolophium dirhodum TaxID=44670 RepID=UPI00298F80E1|nr:lysophospholipid acyltransferase 7 [Metopolophium dirhodum]XP_060859647.1 lysophospholipid acyltransferase 7 [Metopolophium dirhodum]
MYSDDTVYVGLLVLSFLFSFLFRKVKHKNVKQWMSTIYGAIIVLTVSGLHIVHPIICTLVNSILIQIDKRRCHILSFLFTFGYLIFFRMTTYFGIPYPPAHTNLIQMMLTLKLVGLSFEVHDSYLIKLKQKDAKCDAEKKFKTICQPSILEVFHYAFCYVGILTGPYFKYRTYWDLFNHNYWRKATYINLLIKKIRIIPTLIICHLATSWIFPLSEFKNDSFYTSTSLSYRLWYMYSSFFIFRTRLYLGFIFSELICIASGMGAYPEVTDPQSGSGPTRNFESLETEYSVKEEVYNFDCIESIDIMKVETISTVRGATRIWNMTIQYWIAEYVYRRIPVKKLRTLVAFGISALWHGIYTGYYVSLCSVPFYLAVEDIYDRQYRNYADSAGKRILWTFFLYTMKMYQFSFWGCTFQLLHIDLIFKYCQSIYFLPYIVLITMYAISRFNNLRTS